jgi:hypothetical protein
MLTFTFSRLAAEGRCAVRAVEIITAERLTDNPRTAWDLAARELDLHNLHPCAKLAFEDLWYKGKIKGSIEQTTFVPKENARYVLEGLVILQDDPHLNMHQVWTRIPGAPPNMNGQMQVLFGLRGRNLIIGLPPRSA